MAIEPSYVDYGFGAQYPQHQKGTNNNVLIPERYATGNNGMEALGSNWDVFADEAPGRSVEYMEHERVIGTTRVVVPPLTRSGDVVSVPPKISQQYATNTMGTDHDITNVHALYADSGWYMGWRIECAMDTNELGALRKISATTGTALPPLTDVDLVGLIKKLYAGATSVSAHADRFHAQTQQAYGHDIPQLRQRVIALEQQQRAVRERQFRDAEQQSRELEMLRKQREAMIIVFKQIREVMVCPICQEVAILPKVLGSCGHIACQNCLRQLDDVAFASLTSSVGGATARQHLLARRCPLCRTEIIGAAFPILPLKEIASILIVNGCIEMASVQKHLEFKSISYEKQTAEAKHIHALQMGCYAQSQLAQHSVTGTIATVTQEQWIAGVYILFESAVSRVFFETFATTLHGKAGGVNVLVNASQV